MLDGEGDLGACILCFIWGIMGYKELVFIFHSFN